MAPKHCFRAIDSLSPSDQVVITAISLTWANSSAAEDNFLAFVITIPSAQLVAYMRYPLPPERISLLVQHVSIEKFGQTLRRGQHRIPRIQGRQRTW